MSLNGDQLQALERERSEIRLTLPVITTIGGGGVIVSAFAAYQLSGLCAIGRSCSRRDSVQTTALVIGGVGVAITGAGLAWLAIKLGDRRKLDERIQQLHARTPATTAWAVYADHEGLGLQLQGRL